MKITNLWMVIVAIAIVAGMSVLKHYEYIDQAVMDTLVPIVVGLIGIVKGVLNKDWKETTLITIIGVVVYLGLAVLHNKLIMDTATYSILTTLILSFIGVSYEEVEIYKAKKLNEKHN